VTSPKYTCIWAVRDGPPGFDVSNLTPKEQKMHHFAVKGKTGVCVYDRYPNHIRHCAEKGNFEGVPADISNNKVCSSHCFHMLRYGSHNRFIHLLSMCIQVRRLRQAPVCFIKIAPHHNMKCRAHPNGCGFEIKVGMMVFVNGGVALFHNCQWYVSVQIMDSDGVCGCKIGYMKALPDEMNLICNRVGVISSIHHRTAENIITVVGKNNVNTHTAIKRKKTKSCGNNKRSGKTLEL
jgi:hypothetical protein